MRHGKYPFIIGFLVVPVALYCTFVVAAYLQSFQLSLTNWSGFGAIKYVGFENFQKLWNDDLFWKSLRHNLYPADPAAARHGRPGAGDRVPAQRRR